jgi:hypothetical protein
MRVEAAAVTSVSFWFPDRENFFQSTQPSMRTTCTEIDAAGRVFGNHTIEQNAVDSLTAQT